MLASDDRLASVAVVGASGTFTGDGKGLSNMEAPFLILKELVACRIMRVRERGFDAPALLGVPTTSSLLGLGTTTESRRPPGRSCAVGIGKASVTTERAGAATLSSLTGDDEREREGDDDTSDDTLSSSLSRKLESSLSFSLSFMPTSLSILARAGSTERLASRSDFRC